MNPDMVLPDNLAFLALMVSKNTAAFALVTVTLDQLYFLHDRDTAPGKSAGEKSIPSGPYILIFMGFTDIWLMSWMGTIRELSRMNWHIYKVFKDVTPEKYAPTLAESGVFVTGVVWTFFHHVMTLIIWLGTQISKNQENQS